MIEGLKILKTSGAYWRGDSSNPQLTRIYAITYPNKKELRQYLNFLSIHIVSILTKASSFISSGMEKPWLESAR